MHEEPKGSIEERILELRGQVLVLARRERELRALLCQRYPRPEDRYRLARRLVAGRGVSVSRACAALGLARSTYHLIRRRVDGP